jgi:hypothetical protein
MMEWFKRLFRRKQKHAHLFIVVRCVEFSRRDYHDGKHIPGTNLLMRCSCGLWKVEWLPGTWTTGDFERERPIDMDSALESITQERKP